MKSRCSMRCVVVKDQNRFSFVAVELSAPFELWQKDLNEAFFKDFD
jgi:hypothetical protein